MNLKDIDIPKQMKHYNVPGLSLTLIENNQISITENYGVLEARENKNVTTTSIFNACSISKFLTVMLVMKLTEQGLLDLDEDVNEKLVSWKVPRNAFTENKKVTLRNLLSHQSGIIDPKGSFTELDSTIGSPSMFDLLAGNTPYCKESIEVTYEPESEFHYSDAGYCIIQQLVEDVTKKSFQQVVNEFLFKPLAMENSTLDMKRIATNSEDFSCGHYKYGEVVEGKYPIYPYPAASGLWTNSIDLAKLAIELMNALKGESKIGISARRAKEIISPQGGKVWSGLGVFLEGSEKQFEITSLGWGIGFQCMMVLFPNMEKGAIIMTNAELGVHQMEGIIGEIYTSLKI
ncbi:serine hydrolase domain-containing protein [Oceanobacillus picturae]|uniref:serine hydrolase domain-containing protein n=1 Tax=Oceanobacillus picturae TaxID=171693 RepID=UPI000E691A36|nr:serine hydrolase domain-containing protein [Oceanobacillus picturae]RIU94786.1 class A beta-lactamase-related serine hydrolase [Oceanobacillus picturae]